jgi:hypothetical protein
MKKTLQKTILFLTLFMLYFNRGANAQCCNFHATLITYDNCTVAGDRTQTVNVTSGTAPFTYQWINTNTGLLVAGTTSLNTSGVSFAAAIVTDANGCVDTTMGDWYSDLSSCTVIGFPPTTISATCANFNIIITKNDGPALGDVLMTGTPSGGAATTFNYFWYGQAISGYVSGTGSGASFTSGALTNGLHFMQVTDGNGCVARDSIYIDDCNTCQNCPSDSISLNTGVDNSYALLSGGTFDNHWVLSRTPTSSGTSIAPYVVSTPDPAWANITSPIAKWINYDDVAGANSFLNGLHTFTRKFTVCEAGNFLINYTAYADNDVTLYVDGTLISATAGSLIGYQVGNGTVATNVPITLSAGTHNISAVVNNVGNLQGLYVEGKVSPALIGPGKVVPDTCPPSQVFIDSVCNVAYDDFSTAALWTHPVLPTAVSCPANFNTLAITGNKFKFLQSRDNDFNFMYRNVGPIDNDNFSARIDFKHQTTVPGWGAGHTVLALTDLPLPFHNDPGISTGGTACSSILMPVSNSVLDGIEVAFESSAVASVSTYEFKVYLKDNGVKTLVGTPISVPGNSASYIKIKRTGTTSGLLNVFSDVGHTASIGSTAFTIPATIQGLQYVVLGTHEYQESDRMLTGTLDNLCIKNKAPLVVDDVIPNGKAIQIYPNPTSNFITLSKPCNVVLTDIAGRQLLSAQKIDKVNLSSFPQGLYLLYLTGENGQLMQTNKIIKD